MLETLREIFFDIDKDMGESINAVWLALGIFACLAILFIWKYAL